MKSVRQAIAKLQIRESPEFRIPGDFQSCPQSLKEVLRVAYLPPLDINNFEYRHISDEWFGAYTDHEGIAYAGERPTGKHIWLLSSNDGIRVFRVTGSDAYMPDEVTQIGGRSEREILGQIEYSTDGFYGVTQIAFHKGLIFAPYEPEDSNTRDTLLLALSMDLDVVGYSELENVHGGWCAINPWDEHLYVATDYENAKDFTVYDVSGFYDLYNHKEDWGQYVQVTAVMADQTEEKRFRLFARDGQTPDEVGQIQGVCFSPNGRVYVARYLHPADGLWWNYINVYNALTGALQSVSSELDFAGFHDEIEGIAIHPSGVLYVAVCINTPLRENPFAVYAFKSRDPLVPV